jgi:acyl-CoA hydrolase
MPTPRASFSEMLEVVLPNDANPLGFALGGHVMHLIDMAGAIAAHRHTRELVVTAAVDGLQFLHPIRVGDLVILHARVTATFRTSLEVEVEVYSEGTLTGERQLTSVAYLTFVTVARAGGRREIPPLVLETDDDRRRAREADARRTARLAARRPR